VPLYKGESIQSFGEQEVGLSLNGKPIRTHSWALNSRLVVGEEGPGLEKIKFFTGLKIETAGVESLNATVSASLALFSYRLQHPLK
jgi:TrmH family RNA methyltransferase